MRNLILGIESSCDDSSFALMDVQNYDLVFYEKISQEEKHSEFGGVVPELAARLHTQILPTLVQKISPYFSQIKAIAVSNEPGLSVSLISGVSVAKALSISLKIPLIAVNHLIGHIYSLFLNDDFQKPLGVLLVSGGHTLVLDIDKKVEILAKTSDDSFGESFDKVAKMLGFGYPGGQIIENLAKNGDDKFDFTIPLLHDKRMEFSFSGLKNQVRLKIEEFGKNLQNNDICDIAASFQKTAVLHILNKLEKICKERNFKNFGVVGGASANLYLREKLQNLADNFDFKLNLAPLKFCSDNAAMIARVGVEKFRKKEFVDYKNLQIYPKFSELEI